MPHPTRPIRLEALLLREGRYAVRPAGQLGTCGWSPIPWDVCYVNAHNPGAAIRRALREGWMAGVVVCYE